METRHLTLRAYHMSRDENQSEFQAKFGWAQRGSRRYESGRGLGQGCRRPCPYVRADGLLDDETLAKLQRRPQ